MAINVLGLAGSPEIGGNTELLLDKTLEGCKSWKEVNVEKIVVSKLNIKPCVSCRSCEKTGMCKTRDDMQVVYSKLASANRIVVASPVYFMGVTAQLKCLIDRCQVLWARKFLINENQSNHDQNKSKKGVLISTCGNKNPDMFEGVAKTVKSFFVTCDFEYDEDSFMLFCGLEEKTAILNYPDYLKTAFETGKKLIE